MDKILGPPPTHKVGEGSQQGVKYKYHWWYHV